MKTKTKICIAAILACFFLVYLWQEKTEVIDTVGEEVPKTESSSQPTTNAQTLEELLTKLQQAKHQQNLKNKVADETETVDLIKDTGTDSPDEVSLDGSVQEQVINIGPLIHPELDDPNFGQPESEPVEIGELLDPETYVPPPPKDEKEINIGPLLPPPGEEPPVEDPSSDQQLTEIGQPIDPEAEPELDF